jgi:DNA topoisomerase-3
MGKQLVLAEKPSVGRELARVLQCRKRERGFSEGDRYVVTWALGHLVELAQPAEYNERYKRWHMQDLPMLPAQLRQSIIKQTSDQYHVVENLLRREDIDSLVIATDAGREGELVARWIMKMAGWQKEVKRLWISSQTDSAIEQGFAKLKDGDLYENLYAAAEARAAADWYVGMNVTRALTCRYDAKLSAGRVQTPTLALMTDREDEIEAFSGGFYWTIRADFGGFTASWQDESGSIRITEEQKSEAIIEKIKGKEGTIVSVDKLEKTEQPPLAYDLTELQRDANSQLSFSAKQTLDVLQGLYENHKIVTYPRTDSRYITPDIVPTLAGRLKAMDATPFGQVASLFVEHGYRSDMDRFVMESGVTDHHAIIPTEQRVDLNRLSKDERSLWELIALRFMEVLSGDYIYETTTVEVHVLDERFLTRFTVPVKQGWRDMARLIGKRSAAAIVDIDEGSSTRDVKLVEGNLVTVGAVRSRRNTTNPPERYTEATLLSAMEHAGRFVEDSALKKRLGGGLGTPATRADIIEKLIQNHYVEREGKYLVPTPKGRELVRLAPSELRSPELTALWEDRLAAIADGKEKKETFVEDIKANARKLVSEVSSNKERFEPTFPDGKQCPFCASPMMRATDEFGQVHFICQRLSCSYEEAQVKRRKKGSSAKMTVADSNKPKKMLVKTKTVPASSATGKKVVVVKRSTAKVEVAEEWETVTEVVRPSKLERRGRFDDHESTSATPRRGRGNDRTSTRTQLTNPNRSHGFSSQTDSGTTFADLLAASEKRKRERDKKRKK